MRLPNLVDLLLAHRAKAAARAAHRQSHDDLFPLLSAIRLEERRLLNAAPVAAATHTVSSTSSTTASPDHGSGSHGSHQDVANLAQSMHQGPAYGQFTANMSSSSLYGSGRTSNGNGTSATNSPPKVGTSSAAPLAPSNQAVSNNLAANTPPVNTLPTGPLATNEDTPLVIAGISVADADSGPSPIVARFEVNNGTLTVDTSTPGTTFLPGGIVQLGNGAVVTGNGTDVLQIVGTVDQINAALAPGLTYTPGLNYDGADTLTMVTNDLGATGSGGPMQATNTVAINVAEVNDAINTLPAGPLATNEDTPLVVSGIAVSDVDSTSSPLVTRFQVDHGTLTIDTSMPGTTVLPGGIIQLGNGAIVLGNGTNVLQIVGTTAQINAALAQPAGLTYTPAANYDGADTLTMVTNDPAAGGLGGSVTSTVAINVAEVNDAINTLPVGPLATNEDTPLVISGIAVSDVDSNVSPLVVRFQVEHGTLSVDASVPGVVVLGNGTNILQIVGTPAQINATLAQPTHLTYTPAANYDGADTLTMVTNDPAAGGLGGSVTSSVAINVAEVNDAINTLPAGPLATNEDTPLVVSGIAVSDVDSTSSPLVTRFQVDHGTLTIDTSMPGTIALPGGIIQLGNGAIVLGNGTNVLQIVGTTAQINAALAQPKSLTYLSDSDYVGGDTLTMVTDDPAAGGKGGSVTSTVAISIAPVAPVITNLMITPGQILIANTATLTGNISDPGDPEAYTLTIDWGDGTAQQVVALPVGTTSFSLTHAFTDNVRGMPLQVNTVQVSVVDDHPSVMGTASTTIAVQDVAPNACKFRRH